jgi:hypothetical protein
MTAFATPANLGARMKRTFTTDEQAWVATLLGDAAAYLRGVMKAEVFPVQTSTFTAYPVGGRVDMPQPYVVSIGPVVDAAGAPVNFSRFEDGIYLYKDEPVDITFTYGLVEAPQDLVGLNCAIVSGQIGLIEQDLGLSIGGLSSVALDDFKVAFADGGAGTGLSLPAPQLQYLRDTYGTSGWVVGSAP